MRILITILTLVPFFTHAQGDYERIRSGWDKMKKLGYLGQGVKVAILDCGAISQGSPGDETWINFDYGYNFIDDNEDVSTTCDHGNFVLTAVKSSEGIAPNATIYILKIADDSGTPDSSAIKAALQYVIDSAIDVINISYQYTFATFQSALTEVMEAGTIVMASAGAATTLTTTATPANLPGVIAVNNVSAVDTARNKAVLAPAEPEGAHGVTIAASGVSCYVIGNSNVRVLSNGTSFSSPWLAGAFAAYKSRYPTMTNAAVMQLILDRAYKLEDTQLFNYGRPLF